MQMYDINIISLNINALIMRPRTTGQKKDGQRIGFFIATCNTGNAEGAVTLIDFFFLLPPYFYYFLFRDDANHLIQIKRIISSSMINKVDKWKER